MDFWSVLLLSVNSLQAMQSLSAFLAQYLVMKKKMEKGHFSVNSRRRKSGKRMQSSVIDSACFTCLDGQKCEESFP